MPLYGSPATVLKMLRPDESASYGADVDARLSAIQAAVSSRLEYELRTTFGVPGADTTQILYAGPSPTLILPVPARSITSVTVGGIVAGGTVTGGTLFPATTYAFDPVDAQGRILGLRLLSGLWWGVSDEAGTPLMPVVIVGSFTDSDADGSVPDDVTYVANLVMMRTFQREQTGVGGVSGPDGSFSPPLDPWKDPLVRSVLDRYRVQRIPVF